MKKTNFFYKISTEIARGIFADSSHMLHTQYPLHISRQEKNQPLKVLTCQYSKSNRGKRVSEITITDSFTPPPMRSIHDKTFPVDEHKMVNTDVLAISSYSSFFMSNIKKNYMKYVTN